MNKSFKDRLAALEALERQAELDQAAGDQVFDETDADALDDADLIAEAAYGVYVQLLSFGSGALAVARYFHPRMCPEERYWTRIAERAGSLCQEQRIVLLPLSREDAQQALALLDSGVLTVRPFTDRCWRSHNHTIQLPYPSSNELHAIRTNLARAFDQVVAQTGCAHIESADVLRAELIKALEDIDHESVQETA